MPIALALRKSVLAGGRVAQWAVTLASAPMVGVRFPLYVRETSGCLHALRRLSSVFTILRNVSFSSALYLCCIHSLKGGAG